jgi:HD-like signal output (HDOD) protein
MALSADITTPTQTPIQRIREALGKDDSMPSLGRSVATVAKIAADDTDTVDDLARAILSDVSLTQRLLRCANSPLYRTTNSAPVTTVSRALVLLGFDQIRSLALSMMLVDKLVPSERAQPLRRDFAQALSAAAVARCALQRRWPSCTEEGAIAAMFRSIGRLVAAVHAPEAVAAVRAKVAEGMPEIQAAKQLIGCTYDDLTHEIVSSWGLPPRIEQSLVACAARPSEPRSSLEWVRLASSFADEAALLQRRFGTGGRDRAVSTLTRRFGDAIGLDAEGVADVLRQAQRETEQLAQALGMSSALDTSAEKAGPTSAAATRGDSGGGKTASVATPVAGQACGSTDASRRRLLSSLSKISDALAGSQGTHRVVQIAVEGLREALGASRVVYFARDDSAAAYRPRAAAGCELANLRNRIAMPIQFVPNLFHAALARGADLSIADLTVETVRARLPTWLEPNFPTARGFLLLPVMIDGRPMGFFYIDRDQAGHSPPSGDQVDAIRLLRNQVVLALRTEPAAR